MEEPKTKTSKKALVITAIISSIVSIAIFTLLAFYLGETGSAEEYDDVEYTDIHGAKNMSNDEFDYLVDVFATEASEHFRFDKIELSEHESEGGYILSLVANRDSFGEVTATYLDKFPLEHESYESEVYEALGDAKNNLSSYLNERVVLELTTTDSPTSVIIRMYTDEPDSSYFEKLKHVPE